MGKLQVVASFHSLYSSPINYQLVSSTRIRATRPPVEYWIGRPPYIKQAVAGLECAVKRNRCLPTLEVLDNPCDPATTAGVCIS